MEIVNRKIYTAIFYEMALFLVTKSTFEVYLCSGNLPKKRAHSITDIEEWNKLKGEGAMFFMYIGKIDEEDIEIKVKLKDIKQHSFINLD